MQIVVIEGFAAGTDSDTDSVYFGCTDTGCLRSILFLHRHHRLHILQSPDSAIEHQGSHWGPVPRCFGRQAGEKLTEW